VGRLTEVLGDTPTASGLWDMLMDPVYRFIDEPPCERGVSIIEMNEGHAFS